MPVTMPVMDSWVGEGSSSISKNFLFLVSGKKLPRLCWHIEGINDWEKNTVSDHDIHGIKGDHITLASEYIP